MGRCGSAVWRYAHGGWALRAVGRSRAKWGAVGRGRSARRAPPRAARGGPARARARFVWRCASRVAALLTAREKNLFAPGKAMGEKALSDAQRQQRAEALAMATIVRRRRQLERLESEAQLVRQRLSNDKHAMAQRIATQWASSWVTSGICG